MASEGIPWPVVNAMPLATIWTEAEIARDRINDRMTVETILIWSAVTTVVAGGSLLSDTIKDLRGE